MERERPVWLDEAFLATVLQGGEGNEPPVEVLNFSAHLAVAPGNNYLSYIFRVRVEYREGGAEARTTSLMVKAPITKGVISDMSERFDVFGREARVYRELIPKMNERLGLELGPKCFHCPLKAVVLEDLKEAGYVMVDKRKQLDFSHCEQAVTKLAKFHAASVALLHEDPDLVKSIGEETMFVEGEMFDKQFRPWVQLCVKAVAGIGENLEGCQPASEFLTRKIDTLSDTVQKLCKPKTDGLNVLNHGDFWMNNVMFSHDDEGEVEDVKMIDFQVLRYSSPALDLVYFVWVSANEDVRESMLDRLFFESYLPTLNSTLDQLGCQERMTPEELRQDLKKAVDFAIIAITNTFPFAISDADNVVDMEDLSEKDLESINVDSPPDEKFMKVFQGKTFNALLPNLLKHFYAWTTSL